MNIDYSVLDQCIKDLHVDGANVEAIVTSLVECGNVDEAFGHLIYGEDGDYREGGIELDAAILDGLPTYVATLIQ